MRVRTPQEQSCHGSLGAGGCWILVDLTLNFGYIFYENLDLYILNFVGFTVGGFIMIYF